MFCSKCGKEIDVGVRICPHCGEVVAAIVDVASVADERDPLAVKSTPANIRISRFRKGCLSAICFIVALGIAGHLVENVGKRKSIESRTEEDLRDLIQEKLLDNKKLSSYVALDAIEDYTLNLAVDNVEMVDDWAWGQRLAHSLGDILGLHNGHGREGVRMWRGTARIILKAKHGPPRTEAFDFDVWVTEQKDSLELEYSLKDAQRSTEKLIGLLESAGYEENN